MIINRNKGVENTSQKSKAQTIQNIKLTRIRNNNKKPVFLRTKTPNLKSDLGTNG